MRKTFKKSFAKLGLVSVATLGLATSANAAIDIAAATASLSAGSTQIESYVPVILDFIIVIVVAGAFFRMTKRAG